MEEKSTKIGFFLLLLVAIVAIVFWYDEDFSFWIVVSIIIVTATSDIGSTRSCECRLVSVSDPSDHVDPLVDVSTRRLDFSQ